MLAIHSEIDRLDKVLVHEPGIEVDMMVPSMMEELLFDDILFGQQAREEHAKFRRVFQLLGVEVVEALDLLKAALASEDARRWVVSSLLGDASSDLSTALATDDADALAVQLVGGVRRPADADPADGLFLLPPIPNWCFQRDPQVAIGNGVLISAMATEARQREALLASAIFRFHPEFAGRTEILWDPFTTEPGSPFGIKTPHLEGGDVLVLSPDIVAIGYSARTNEAGIRAVAGALAALDGGPRWLLIVELPRRRAYMHLDTVMTPIDRDACLAHAPVILRDGFECAKTYEVDLHASQTRFELKTDFLSTLAARGMDLKPLKCGGDDPVRQQREQWTDGANAFCLAPGVLTLYERNEGTLEQLDRAGFDVVSAEDLLLGTRELDLENPKRTCIVLGANEITRARGGPHCLTHALARRR